MCFGLGVESGLTEEKKRGKKGNLLGIWKKWIQWSRLKWDDGSKIEFEKNYTKVKNIVEKSKEKYF